MTTIKRKARLTAQRSTIPRIEGTDEAWESGQLGTSAAHAKVVRAAAAARVDEAAGLQLVSIRLPRPLIDDLKGIAAVEGLGYQPLVRRVLIRFVDAEKRRLLQERAADAEAQAKIEAAEASTRRRKVT